MEVEKLSRALQRTSVGVSSTLAEARASFSDNKDGFLLKNYGILGRAIGIYAELFGELGCKSREELESLWAKQFHHCHMRDAVEDLLLAEEEWDQFLMEVDQSMNAEDSSSHHLNVGSSLKSSPNLELTNIQDSSTQTLGQALIASLNCTVHIVSFGSREGALRWQHETGCSFPIWIDSSRSLYSACGFKRSIFQVWRISTMVFYGSQVSQNVELPKAFSDYEDDPLQMAGNLILDSAGSVVLLHKSQYPADRPSVQEMVELLRKL